LGKRRFSSELLASSSVQVFYVMMLSKIEIKRGLVMKKCLAVIALILPLSLSGCLPAAFVLGATAGGAIIYDKRPVKVMLQDRNATQTAQDYINADPILRKRTHISVATFNHIMILVGQAETPALRARAYRLASNAKHVQKIYNEITIAPPTSFGRRTDDAWITTKAKSAMLAKGGLHSTQIKVVTENGTVYLMGEVSRQQGNLAASVARRVAGVKKVVKVFQYL
jgi:osmotically-inducible protein OsmY